MHSEPKNASIALSLWLGRRGAIKPVWIRINTGYDSPNVMSELERRLKIEDFGGRKHSSSSSSSHDVTTQQLQCCLFSCLIMMLDLSISSFPPSIHTPLCSESVPVVRGQKKLFVCVCVCVCRRRAWLLVLMSKTSLRPVPSCFASPRSGLFQISMH